MGAIAGYNGAVKIGATAVGNMGDWSLDIKVANLDTSQFGDQWKEFIAGIKEWSGKFAGRFDESDAGQSAAQSAMLGGTTVTLELDVDGTHHYSGTAFIQQLSPKASASATVDVEYTFQGTGALTYT